MEEKGNTPKKLYRSRTDRLIAGVCGGLAAYFNMDANLMRIIFVILAFMGGLGLILYIAALIIVPENPFEEETAVRRSNTTVFWALLLIVLGFILLFRELGLFYYFHLWNIPWSVIWAIFLIALGLLLIFAQSRQSPTSVSPDEAERVAEEPPLKIYRSRDDRMLAGVCGGLAKYFNIDSAIVRLAWVLASMASVGLGILIYIILIFVFPEEPSEQTA